MAQETQIDDALVYDGKKWATYNNFSVHTYIGQQDIQYIIHCYGTNFVACTQFSASSTSSLFDFVFFCFGRKIG